MTNCCSLNTSNKIFLALSVNILAFTLLNYFSLLNTISLASCLSGTVFILGLDCLLTKVKIRPVSLKIKEIVKKKIAEEKKIVRDIRKSFISSKDGFVEAIGGAKIFNELPLILGEGQDGHRLSFSSQQRTQPLMKAVINHNDQKVDILVITYHVYAKHFYEDCPEHFKKEKSVIFGPLAFFEDRKDINCDWESCGDPELMIYGQNDSLEDLRKLIHGNHESCKLGFLMT